MLNALSRNLILETAFILTIVRLDIKNTNSILFLYFQLVNRYVKIFRAILNYVRRKAFEFLK